MESDLVSSALAIMLSAERGTSADALGPARCFHGSRRASNGLGDAGPSARRRAARTSAAGTHPLARMLKGSTSAV